MLEIVYNHVYKSLFFLYLIMHHLKLPDDLEVINELGVGRRSVVYLASQQDTKVVVKVYKPKYIEKYQSQYGVNIGEFEYHRNRTLFDVACVRKYVAQPYQLLRPQDGYSLALVQEYVEGTLLLDLLQQLKHLPKEVLDIGYLLVKEAAKQELYDLDISPGNIQVLQDEAGHWYPKLYDFNLMPQYMQPPNPFMRIGFALGLRSKNYRDYRSLKDWEKRGLLAGQ